MGWNATVFPYRRRCSSMSYIGDLLSKRNIAMTAIDDLRAADTIRTSNFSAVLHAFGDHPIGMGGSCIIKQSGTLNMAFPLHDASGATIVVLNLKGAQVPGASRVAWTVDEDVDVTYDGHQISHVSATLLADVAGVPSVAGTACHDALPRAFNVSLTGVSQGSAVSVTVKIFFGSQTFTVDTIQMSATAGGPAPANV
jgi:hypothetical protein